MKYEELTCTLSSDAVDCVDFWNCSCTNVKVVSNLSKNEAELVKFG